MTIIECTREDAFSDAPTAETFCMECDVSGVLGGCTRCDGPMCEKCLAEKGGMCVWCQVAVEIISEDEDLAVALDEHLAFIGL